MVGGDKILRDDQLVLALAVHRPVERATIALPREIASRVASEHFPPLFPAGAEDRSHARLGEQQRPVVAAVLADFHVTEFRIDGERSVRDERPRRRCPHDDPAALDGPAGRHIKQIERQKDGGIVYVFVSLRHLVA